MGVRKPAICCGCNNSGTWSIEGPTYLLIFDLFVQASFYVMANADDVFQTTDEIMKRNLLIRFANDFY